MEENFLMNGLSVFSVMSTSFSSNTEVSTLDLQYEKPPPSYDEVMGSMEAPPPCFAEVQNWLAPAL